MKCVCCKRQPQQIAIIRENAERRNCSSIDYVKWELDSYISDLDIFVCPECVKSNPHIKKYEQKADTENSKKVAKVAYLQQFDSDLNELKVELGMFPPDIAASVMPRLNSKDILYFILPDQTDQNNIHLAVLKQQEKAARDIVNDIMRKLISSEA